MQIEGLPFDTKDIVYAKIGNYPWWPGKIIQIGEHKCQIFYKISFYNDSTYCYVKENDLILYQKFNTSLNKGYQINTQLKKAIEMADNAFSKKKCLKFKKIVKQQIKSNILNSKQIDIDSNNKQIEMNQQSQICIQIQKQEQKIEQIKQVQYQQKVQLLSPKIQDTQQSTMFYMKQSSNPIVNPHINSSLLQKQQMYNLLKQYKLDNIPKYIQKTKSQHFHQTISLKQIQQMNINNEQQQIQQKNLFQQQQQSSSSQSLIKKQKKIRKVLKKYKDHKKPKRTQKRKTFSDEQNQLKFIKKLTKILIDKGFNIEKSRQISLKMIDKINRKYYEKSQRCIGLVTVIQNIGNVQSIQQFQQCLKMFEMMNSPKSSMCKQDQQRSKFTQIQRQLHEEIQIL